VPYKYYKNVDCSNNPVTRYIIEPAGQYWQVVDQITGYVLGIYERQEPALAWQNFLASQQEKK